MIVAVFLSFTACNQSSGKKSHTADQKAAVQDTTAKYPVMAFTQTVHDFGNIVQGEIVKTKFHFKNVGNAPLKISDVKTTCGCTVGDYPQKLIPPGGEGDLAVTFNSTYKRGYQGKIILIIANTKPRETALRITTFVKVPDNK